MNSHLRRTVTAVVFAAAFLAACGNSPITPDPPVVPAPTERYTLALTSADECGVGRGEGSLPEGARDRRYTVDVQQDGRRLWLTLTSPTLRRPVRTAGWTNGEYVSFDFQWRDDGFPGMADVLADGTAFFIEGSAFTSVDINRFEGSFHGRLSLVQGVDTTASPVASCFSTRHRFVMSR